MKKLLTSFSAGLIGIVLLVQAGTPSGNVEFSWTNTNAPGLVQAFCLYWSPSATVPMSNWTKIATIPPTQLTYATNIQVGENYFAMTCSNWWGESPFSLVVSTPALPSSQLGFGIKRMP
jgi:hypothetical protein